jgi:hypothetical protein
MTKKLIIAALVPLVLLSMFHVYLVRCVAGGSAMTKGDAQYLVLRMDQYGYRYTLMGYALDSVKQFFRVPLPLSDDHAISVTVIDIDPTSTHEHTLNYGKEPAVLPEYLTPYSNTIYAECVGLKLCKWDGDGFRYATPEESQAFGGVDRLSRTYRDNAVVNGWKIQSIDPKADSFKIGVSDTFETSIKAEPVLVVELSRPGRSPETLFRASQGIRWVSKSEYSRTFKE